MKKTEQKIKELKRDGTKLRQEIKKGVMHLWAGVKQEYKKVLNVFNEPFKKKSK